MKILRGLMVLVMLAVVGGLTGGCGQPEGTAALPSPLEPTRESVGHICGMAILEHPGPKGHIFVAGEGAPLWFSSVRDAFTYYFLDGATRKLLAFYVNDMAQGTWEKPAPGSWIQAEQALFVVESRRQGGMGGQELVPFRERTAAERFQKEHGGRILPFAEVTREMVLAPVAADAHLHAHH